MRRRPRGEDPLLPHTAPPQKTLRGSRAVLAMILLLFGPREDIMDRYQDAEVSF
jgi:hypothetical protein